MLMFDFAIEDRILVCDMSKFTLGVSIYIVDGGKIITSSKAPNIESAITTIYGLCETQGISNVFLKPLAPERTDIIIDKFKLAGQKNFSKSVDKIHFHVI